MFCASLDGRGVWGRMDTYIYIWHEPGWEAGLGKDGYMYIYIYMAESLLHSPETVTTLLIGYTPVQNKKYDIWRKNKSGNKKKLVRKTN